MSSFIENVLRLPAKYSRSCRSVCVRWSLALVDALFVVDNFFAPKITCCNPFDDATKVSLPIGVAITRDAVKSELSFALVFIYDLHRNDKHREPSQQTHRSRRP
jgi:hypothetical protein